jgi:hypothetical protein
VSDGDKSVLMGLKNLVGKTDQPPDKTRYENLTEKSICKAFNSPCHADRYQPIIFAMSDGLVSIPMVVFPSIFKNTQ